ncbi:hypothetical protein K6T82_22670 [Flavobacterium sp. 17A]|uniref:Uncharacterized protein n=1 Tax=Flavobacterium potami TaxID=2872310 RepID=A0A9X1KS32_9FLAO|nr:hypothetical protein [Flavobacterium potami]MBZ4037583.1 hypothetical protein [Flavobacterium potami]
MKTNFENRYTAELNDFKCSRPDHIDTAHENEDIDQEFTSGQNDDTNHKNQYHYFSEDDCYEIIESGLNTAEDNTPFSTYDEANPYDSYNLDHEDDKYNCPPYRNFDY